MKVMEIIRDAEGGMKIHFITLVKGMAMCGVNVTALCSFPNDSLNELKYAGVKAIPFSIPGNIRVITDIKCLTKMVLLIRRIKPDVVHCHGFKAGLLGRLAGMITGVPLIYTVHNFADYGRSKTEKWMIRSIEKHLAYKTGAIICVSHALKNSMIKQSGIEKEKFHVIYNSVPCWPAADRSKVRKSYNIGENSVLIGTVARLIPSKGMDILLNAAHEILQMYRHARIMIVGSGPDEDKLKDLTKALDISEKVVFTGKVSDIQDYYAAFDIFVLPTLSEGLGISVLEAMSFGLPVIASSVGGIPEWIVHERNGFLVKPGDVHELKLALQLLIEDPEKAAQYGHTAKQDIQKGLTEQDMVDKTLSVIKAIYMYKYRKQSKTGDEIWAHEEQK